MVKKKEKTSIYKYIESASMQKWIYKGGFNNCIVLVWSASWQICEFLVLVISGKDILLKIGSKW